MHSPKKRADELVATLQEMLSGLEALLNASPGTEHSIAAMKLQADMAACRQVCSQVSDLVGRLEASKPLFDKITEGMVRGDDCRLSPAEARMLLDLHMETVTLAYDGILSQARILEERLARD